MNPWLSDCLLFAERTRLDEIASRMGDGFRRGAAHPDPANTLLTLGIVVTLAVLWALLAHLAYSRIRRTPQNGPRRLFVSLCRAHRLRWSEGWLLWRLARLAKLPEPALVFVEPQRFAPEGLPAPLARRRAELESLRARLFAGLEDGEPDGPTTARTGTPAAENRWPAA